MLKCLNARNLLRRFRRNEDGNMTVIFAVSAVVLIGGIGAAMDYSTLSNAKARSQSIADVTALNAAVFVKTFDRAPETFDEGLTAGEHTAEALGYEFKGFVEGGASNVSVNIVYDDNAKEARVSVSGNTVPTFIQVLGKQELSFSAESVVSYLDVDETHPASIVLVLDNSGSMRWDSEQLTNAGTRPANAKSRISGLQTSVRTFRDELRGRIGNQLQSEGLRVLRTGILPYNSEIVPLPDDAERLMDWGFGGVDEGHITAMRAAGGTNSNPPMARANEWLDIEDEQHRQEAVRHNEDYRQPLKFVVFMTDGQNTTGGFDFIEDNTTGRYYGQIDGKWFTTRRLSTANFYGFREGRIELNSDRLTIETCQEMHAEGTVIYTIGYALDVGFYYDPENPSNPGEVTPLTEATANNLLRVCASKPEFFIEASDGDELEGAFDQIQNSIVKELIRIKS